MNKKDRIAVVVSVVYFLWPLALLIAGNTGSIILIAPLILYWGYRFIQNDISFLKVEDES